MKKLRFILIMVFVVGLGSVWAEDPIPEVDQTYFHPAASLYIHGDSVGASNLVVRGLSAYPGNPRLEALKKLLEQQQENKDQNKDQNQNQDQQKNQKNKDQQKQDQQNQNNQKNQQDQQKKDQQKNNQDQQNNGEDSNKQKPASPEEDSGAQPTQPDAKKMSEDEAKQLLDAMRQDEKNKRLQLQPIMGAPVKVDKDW
jgi:outer membrane biosynthesis protein TonB